MTKKQEEFCKQLLAQNITCEMPEFTPIYEHVKPIIPKIQDALDYGHQIALDVLKKKKRNKQNDKIPDQWIHSHLVRWAAQTQLYNEGLETQFSEAVDGTPKWQLDMLPNYGLAGEFDKRKYRMFKGKNGQLPAIGLSKVKKDYYRQMHILKPHLFHPDQGDDEPKKYNIIFLWDVSPKNYIQLYLCCPRYWVNNTAYDYFTNLLSHPVEAIISNIVEPPTEEDNIPEIEIQRIDESQGKLI